MGATREQSWLQGSLVQGVWAQGRKVQGGQAQGVPRQGRQLGQVQQQGRQHRKQAQEVGYLTAGGRWRHQRQHQALGRARRLWKEWRLVVPIKPPPLTSVTALAAVTRTCLVGCRVRPGRCQAAWILKRF